MENERLQRRRSRSTARSNTNSGEEGRISQTIFDEENLREGEQNQGERNQFILIPENINEEQIHHEAKNQRRRRINDQDGEENPEEGRRILRGREVRKN